MVLAFLFLRVSLNKTTVRAFVRPRRVDLAKKRFIMSSRLFMAKVPSLKILRLVLVLAGLANAEPAVSRPLTNDLPAAASRPIDFVKDIQPIFASHCYGCHGPDKQEA